MHFTSIARFDQLNNCAALVSSIIRLEPRATIQIALIDAEPFAGKIDIPGAKIASIRDLIPQVDLKTLGDGRARLDSRMVAGEVLRQELMRNECVVLVEPNLYAIAGLTPIHDALTSSEVSLFTDSRHVASGVNLPHPGVIAMRRGSHSDAVLNGWPTELIPDGDEHFARWLAQPLTGFPPPLILPASVEYILRGASEESRHTNGNTPTWFDWGTLALDRANQTLSGEVQASGNLNLVEMLRTFHADLNQVSVPSEVTRRLSRFPERSEFPDGTPMSETLTRMAKRAIDEAAVRDPYQSASDWKRFVAWLNKPPSRGIEAGLTTYHEELWHDRPELQEAYPDLSGEDAYGYAGWLCVVAPERFGLPDELLPPRPEFLGEPEPEEEDEALHACDHAELMGSGHLGVNVAGYLTSELGLGEAARLLIAGLDEAGIPCVPVQGGSLPPSRQGASFFFAPPEAAPFPVNIICMNGDAIPAFARLVGPDFFKGRYTIALWWWETEEIPASWGKAFEFIDEVWVASDLVADAVRSRATVPVTKICLPISLPERRLSLSDELSFPQGFNFYFSFDYYSSIARKNPVGVIEAFKRAFPEEGEAYLTIKSINANHRPWDHAQVLNAAGERSDIRFIDSYVSVEERDALVAECDCYVSLHRSEGLGLTVAEALWFAKPVIATAYGGVMEFLTEENSYLVVSDVAYVGPNAEPYPPTDRWREPDIEQAAAFMREVFEDAEGAQRKGDTGAADIRRVHSRAAAGESMRSRLEEIYAEAPSWGHQPMNELAPIDDSAVSQRIESDPGVRGNAIVRAFRRLMRKLQAPDRERQLGTNRELLSLIRTLDEKLIGIAAQIEADEYEGRAEVMAIGRKVEELNQTLEGRIHQVDSRLDGPAQLVAEHRSLPFISPDMAFEDWTEGPVGTVQGFRSNQSHPSGATHGMADAFRGSEEHVRELMAGYEDLLSDSGPLLDIGCGRGELLDLLRDSGVEASGVDLDAEMVRAAAAKGHEVAHGDALDRLELTPDHSLGAIFSAQVVEHLPYERLWQLLELATAKLRPGGMFVAETVNPHCLNALKAFWVDPTHEHPLFPETMLQLARSAGFASAYVFHPNASGNVERDRFSAPAYTLVAHSRD